MSHPLDETQHTPWGQKVTQEIGFLKGRLHQVETEFSTFRHEVNSKLGSIESDTKWIVDFMKGSKALGSLMLPLTLIGGGLIAIAASIAGWWHGRT